MKDCCLIRQLRACHFQVGTTKAPFRGGTWVTRRQDHCKTDSHSPWAWQLPHTHRSWALPAGPLEPSAILHETVTPAMRIFAYLGVTAEGEPQSSSQVPNWMSYTWERSFYHKPLELGLIITPSGKNSDFFSKEQVTIQLVSGEKKRAWIYTRLLQRILANYLEFVGRWTFKKHFQMFITGVSL